ncbi:DUF6048 family protein [Polaribacter porphyrae]|uniref:Outer membrane protein beta-barrel domain-containing protein n=1 Tax=Polaribacter porphyrae TaxID=1137780 RepID=A0A2S7WTE4_9FLAO|nr:DUF6048 family protein [Polaribacter porphyrae]PQJ80863.1 hypothetical protein BTO18_01475 [Polaribacter porphyrae]
MSKFFISLFFLFCLVDGFSQEKSKDSISSNKDSIVYKSPYGIRIGIDISKPIKASIDGEYNSGIELVGDYRITKRLFIAAELGYESETTQEDFTNSTSKGSYMRLGINFNAYENWLDMNNEVFVGFRYGLSIFEQTLNSFTPNVVTGQLNTPPYFTGNVNNVPVSSDLNAHWSEIMVGIKVETFKNFFISASVSYKVMISNTEPNNFKTLYSPGFNRIFESGTGFGFNYTLSYLIPFKKK